MNKNNGISEKSIKYPAVLRTGRGKGQGSGGIFREPAKNREEVIA